MLPTWLVIALCAGASAAAAYTLSPNDRRANLSVLVCGLFLAAAFAALSLPLLAAVQAAVSIVASRELSDLAASRQGVVVRRRAGGFGFAAAFLALGLLAAVLIKILAAPAAPAHPVPPVTLHSLAAPAPGLLLILLTVLALHAGKGAGR